MANNVTFGELLKRVEALEAATIPRDPNVPYAPHPAYAVAVGWKRKCKAAETELREKTALLHKGTADYQAQYKRADANQAAADMLAAFPGWQLLATEEWEKLRAAADTLERLKDGQTVDAMWLKRDGRDLVDTKLREAEAAIAERDKYKRDSDEWHERYVATMRERDALAAKVKKIGVQTTSLRCQLGAVTDEKNALAAKVEELQSALSSRDPACEPSIPIADHSKLLAEKAKLETTIRAQDDRRRELQRKVQDLHAVIDGLRQQLAARPEYPPMGTGVCATIDGEPGVFLPVSKINDLRHYAEKMAELEQSYEDARNLLANAYKDVAERGERIVDLEHRLVEATNQRGLCYIPLDELTAIRRGAERWRQWCATQPQFVVDWWQAKLDAIAAEKATNDAGG